MLNKIAKEKICPFISNGEKLIKCITDECIAWKNTDKKFSIDEASSLLLEPNELIIWRKYRHRSASEIFNREKTEEELYDGFYKYLENNCGKLEDGYCLKIGDIEK